MVKETLKVKGMHCKSCGVLISDALEELGVKSSVDSKKELVVVEFDEKKVSLKKIKETIKKEGYQVE
ncbi:MAG: cation transporter [Nanoarchaeota archaeon]|nr:cation transporter [Nanoarchaeota archaeon]MBU1622485.1 cation transporter [Nanoarchaeota archaeon]